MWVRLKTRNSNVWAEGVYSKDKFIVKAGGKIRKDFSQHVRGGKAALSYRENKEYVDGDGNIIKDCEFKSPSTAAQFVTGTSINGMLAWKTKDGKSLKASVAEE